MVIHKPASTAAIDWEELLGRLLLIYPDRIENITTALGAKDCTVAAVHILDGDDPRVIDEVFVFPKVLQAQLRPFVGTGDPCCGRLTQGTAKAGQSPPWKLDDPTDADLAVAAADDNNPPF